MEPVSWHIEEYPHTEKTPDWYWAVGIILLASVAVSVILKNFLFAIVLLVGGASLLLLAARKPRIVVCEVDSKGILFGKTFYPFEYLQSFFIDLEIDSPRIILASKKALSPYLIVPIYEEDAQLISETLKRFLPEKEHRESVFLILLRRLGF